MQNNFGNYSARMDSPYLNAPALLGLSQHPAGFSEALRLSRALSTQHGDTKELSTPYSVSAFGSRAAFDFSAIAGNPLFMSSPFMTSAAMAAAAAAVTGLDPSRLPFPPVTVSSPASAVFPHAASTIHHSHIPTSISTPFIDSKLAFPVSVSMATSLSSLDKLQAAAADCHVTSSVAHHHHHQQQQQQQQQQLLRAAAAAGRAAAGGGGGAVAAAARGLSECEEDDEVLTTSSVSERGSSPEDILLRRKLGCSDVTMCPVCGQQLAAGQLSDHLRHELERLAAETMLTSPTRAVQSPGAHFSVMPVTTEAFQRVRANRQMRLRCLSRKRRISDDCDGGDGGGGDASGSEEARHDAQPSDLSPAARNVSQTKRRQMTRDSSVLETSGLVTSGHHSPTAAETIKRQQQLQQQQLAASGTAEAGVTGATGVTGGKYKVEQQEEEEEVDVDTVGDSESGAGQCVWPPAASAQSKDTQVREGEPDTTMERHMGADSLCSGEGDQLQQLRRRLQQLEAEAARCRCSVCAQPLASPRVSTVCWHVHCEHCWLQTLKSDSKCPQCHSVIAAEDLKTVHV